MRQRSVTSSSGIGKSFIIYQLVAQLMASDLHRVVYINKPGRRVMTDCFEILRIIFTADEETFTSKKSQETIRTEKLKNTLEAKERKELIKKLATSSKNLKDLETLGTPDYDPSDRIIKIIDRHITSINEMYRNRGISLVFIIDQMNNLDKLEAQRTFCQQPSEHIKLLLSASANNDVLTLKMHQQNQKQPPLSFSLAEFNAFRTMMNPLMLQTKDEQKIVMSVTGGVPIEVDRFFTVNAHHQQQKTLSAAFDNYRGAFQDVYNPDVVEKFIRQHEERPFALENLKVHMADLLLGHSMKRSVQLFDKRLISKKPHTSLTCFLVPINLEAKEVLIDAYRPYILQRLHSHNFSGIITEAFMDYRSVGNLINNFIIYSYDLSRTISLAVKDPKDPERTLGHLKFENFERVVLLKNEPLKEIVHATIFGTLFVPPNENFPVYDFFFLLRNKSDGKYHLFCFQITNHAEPLKHVKNTFGQFSAPSSSGSKLISAWIKRLPVGVVFQEIWMVNKAFWQNMLVNNQDNEIIEQLNVVFFQEMDIFAGVNF